MKVYVWVRSYVPVRMLARLAAQIGVVTKARSNRMPSPASRSTFGVRMIGLPAQPSASKR